MSYENELKIYLNEINLNEDLRSFIGSLFMKLPFARSFEKMMNATGLKMVQKSLNILNKEFERSSGDKRRNELQIAINHFEWMKSSIEEYLSLLDAKKDQEAIAYNIRFQKEYKKRRQDKDLKKLGI